MPNGEDSSTARRRSSRNDAGSRRNSDSNDMNGVKEKDGKKQPEKGAGKGPNDGADNDSEEDEDDDDGLFGGHDESDDDDEDEGGSADDDYQPAASTSASKRPSLRSSTRSSSSRRGSNSEGTTTKQTLQTQEDQARPSKAEKPSNHSQEVAKSSSVDSKGKQKALPADAEEHVPSTNEQPIASQPEPPSTPSSSSTPIFNNSKRTSPTRKAANALAKIPEEEALEASKPESKHEGGSSEQTSSPGFNMMAIKNAFNAAQTASGTVPPTAAQLQTQELRKHIYQLQITTLLHINVELVKMCMVYQENVKKTASPGQQPDFAMDDPYLALVKRMSSNLGYLAHLNGSSTNNGVPPLPILEPPPNAIEHLRNLYVQLGKSFVMGQRSGLFPAGQQPSIPRRLRMPSQTAMGLGQTQQQADQTNNQPLPPEQATPVTGKRERRESTVPAADDHQPSQIKREKLDNGQPAGPTTGASPSKDSETSSPKRTDAMIGSNMAQPHNRQASVDSNHSRAQTPRLPPAQQQQPYSTPGSISSPMQPNQGGHSESQPVRPPSAGPSQQTGMYASTIPPHIQQHIQQSQAGQQNMNSPYQLSATASQPRTPSAAGFQSPSSPGPNSAHFRQVSGPSMMQSQAGQPHIQNMNPQGPQPQQGHRPSVNFEALAQDIVRTQQALTSARAAQDEKSVYGQLPPDSQAVLANRIHDLENQLDQYRRIYDQAVRGQSSQPGQGSPMSTMQQQQFQQLQHNQQQASPQIQPGTPVMPPHSAAQSHFPPQQQQPLQPIPYHQRSANQDPREAQQQQQQQHAQAMSSPAQSHAPSPAASIHQSPQSANLSGPRQNMPFAQPGGPGSAQSYPPSMAGQMHQRVQSGQGLGQNPAQRGGPMNPPNSGGRLSLQGQTPQLDVQQQMMPPPRPPSVMRIGQSQQNTQLTGSPSTPHQAMGQFRAPSVPASGNPAYYQQQQAMNAGSPGQSYTAPSPASSVNGNYGNPAGLPSMPAPQGGQPNLQQQQQHQMAAQRERMASLGGAPSNPINSNMTPPQMQTGQAQQQPSMQPFPSSQQQQQQQPQQQPPGPSQTQGPSAGMYPGFMPGQGPPGAMQNMQAFRGVPLQDLPPAPPGLNPQQAALFQQAQLRQQAILAVQQHPNPSASQGQPMGQPPPGMMSQPNAQQLAFFRQQQQQQQQMQIQQTMSDGQASQSGMDYAAQIAAVRRAQVESQMQMQPRAGPGGATGPQGMSGAVPGRMPVGYPGFGPPQGSPQQQQSQNAQSRQQTPSAFIGPGGQQFAANSMPPQGLNGQIFQQYGGGQMPNPGPGGQPGFQQKGPLQQRQMPQMHQQQFPMMPAPQNGQQSQQLQQPGSAGMPPNSAASVDFDAYLNMG